MCSHTWRKSIASQDANPVSARRQTPATSARPTAISGHAVDPGSAWDPDTDVEERPVHRVSGRWILDGSGAGYQRAFHAFRGGNADTDICRDPSGSRSVSWRASRRCCTPDRSSSSRRSRPDPRKGVTWWHYMRGADWRHPQGPKLDRSPEAPSGRARGLRRCRELCAMGRQDAAFGSRMGVRGARRLDARHMPGATNSSSATNIRRTHGRENFPGRASCRTGSKARHLSARSPPTAMVSST